MSDSRPIGVFDSGIGGLTVLKELCARFTNESFVYLGDTARLPYGSKSAQTIRKYSEQNMLFLRQQNVKAIVIACNSASTQVLENEIEGLPIYNVIKPGAEAAVKTTIQKRIGVLGTRATIHSQAYTQQILKLMPEAEVFSQACPLFVPLAEEGWDQDPVTNLIVYRYVQPLLQQQVDVVILGCTHYPLLKNSIARVTGVHAELVDSGQAMAEWLAHDFSTGRLQANTDSPAHIKILTTDPSAHFIELGQKILSPMQVTDFENVNL